MKHLDEQTKLSISLVITLLGGATWLTSIHLQSVANAQDLKDMREDLKQIQQMREDLLIVKSDMKRVLRKMGEKE